MGLHFVLIDLTGVPDNAMGVGFSSGDVGRGRS